MSKEKQIEVEVITYEQERLDYFTDLMNKAKNKFNRLFKKYKDAPYLSEEFQRLSDAGRGAEFYEDVVKMLEKGYRKQSEGEWIGKEFDDGFGFKYKNYWCSVCGRKLVGYSDPKDAPYCHCGAKMKGGAE